MRDGVVLRADVYLPGVVPGRFPVVLIRLPYGKREAYCYAPAHGRFWARKGYICVIQDVRGKWASAGVFEPYVNEAQDGWDTLDWVAAQPWCDGNIGMTGESYYGSTQWAVAPLGHPNLRCLAPGNVDPDRYGAVHDGGALCFATAAIWSFDICDRRNLNHYRFDPWHLPLATTAEAAGRQTATYQRLVDHPSRDAEWDALDAPCKYEDITVPMLHWGGWWDVHTHGTIAGWRRVRERSLSAEARGDQWLMLAATDHELSPEFIGKVGRVPVRGHGWSHDRVRRFMDWHLKGEGDFGSSPRVQYYVTGADEWRGADDWPPRRIELQDWYLRSRGHAGAAGGGDGRLEPEGSASAKEAAAGSSAERPADELVYDPADPVQAWCGRNVWSAAGELGDRRPVEERPDVLVYSSPCLEEALEVAGPVCVHLHAASTACDTDFTAALVDVFPDGYAQLVWEGITRARYRDSEREPSLIEPGRVYEYVIDLASVGYVFAPGHCVRLEVSSSNFDRYDRNPNTGGEHGRETRFEIARQTVLHDGVHPSRLVLPVARRG